MNSFLNIPTDSVSKPAEDIAQSINAYLASGHQVLWLICGGSALEVAVAASKHIIPESSRNLTVTLTDERFGPVGHQDSNWQQLMQKGFDSYQATLKPVLQDGLSLSEVTSAYSNLLQVEFTKNNKKVALFGIGVDGHIAGILPHSSAVDSSDWAVGYEALPFQRITMGPSVFEKIDQAWLYYENEQKSAAVSRLNLDLPITDEPAQLIKQIGKVVVYHRVQK
jgi:6-phosphogluconolactonase/glucosamine-6-phosphate isomerase/deaminase